jgi:hypothetical protein
MFFKGGLLDLPFDGSSYLAAAALLSDSFSFSALIAGANCANTASRLKDGVPNFVPHLHHKP